MPTTKKERIIYLTGFFEADGCITTSNGQTFRLAVGNTNKKILEIFQRHLGGYINNGHLPENPKWNTSWKWIISRKPEVLKTLLLFYPHMTFKKPQAKLVIDFCRKYPKPQKGNIKNKKEEIIEYEKVKTKLKKSKTDLHYKR